MSGHSLPAAYQGAWCEVKTADNELIAVGRVKTIMPKYMIISDNGYKMPETEPGTLVKIIVFKPGKEIMVCIGNVYISEDSGLSIVNIISLVNNEKRSFFRVATNIKTTAVYRTSPKEIYPSETGITVLDMSLNGLKFKSEAEIAENTVIGVKLDLKNKKSLMLSCEVVRVIGEKSEGSLKYGCRIIDSEEDRTDDICMFLFDRLREFIKNNMF